MLLHIFFLNFISLVREDNVCGFYDTSTKLFFFSLFYIFILFKFVKKIEKKSLIKPLPAARHGKLIYENWKSKEKEENWERQDGKRRMEK